MPSSHIKHPEQRRLPREARAVREVVHDNENAVQPLVAALLLCVHDLLGVDHLLEVLGPVVREAELLLVLVDAQLLADVLFSPGSTPDPRSRSGSRCRSG